MDRPSELELIRDTLRGLDEGVPLGDGDTTVHVERYLDPDRFERELDARHRRRLHLAAHASELAEPGDFVTRDVLGAPALLVRGDDGAARAFLNVCRHRGATVERREQGRCKRFVCPYHAWTYDRDGALAHVRLREGFPSLDERAAGLTPLACEEAGGFVWVCPDPSLRPTLDASVRAMLAEVEALGPARPSLFARASRVWRANWKILVEGGLESYHFKIAHRDTVGPFFGDTASRYERLGECFRMILPRRTLPSLRDRPEAEWRLVEHANVLYTLPPNASVLVQDGHFVMISMTPLSVDRTRVDLATVGRAPEGPEHSDRAKAFLQGNHDFTVRTLEEDFVIAEQIQRGLSTGANTHLRFAGFERALREFHEGLERELRAAPEPRD